MTVDSSDDGYRRFIPAAPTCQIRYLNDGQDARYEVPEKDKESLVAAGHSFLEASGGEACLLLAGPLVSPLDDAENSTETAVARCCLDRFGYPGQTRAKTIDVVLDTYGGSLDSAFKTVIFLSRFAEQLRIFVPRHAKSAGTLLAIGGDELYLSPFAELGPLDTQIVDPRNPTDLVSALDCYQSVDYVRAFGLSTLHKALVALAKEMQTGIPLAELVNTAENFSIGSIAPILAQVRALDFGGWGRTLKIGELYAKSLLVRTGYDVKQADRIADQLVYGYTHHPFPIDVDEAMRIGLLPQRMQQREYELAAQMLHICRAGRDLFVGFIDGKTVKHSAPVAKTPQDGKQAGECRRPGTEETRRDGQKEPIGRPRDQVTGAVEEGQQFNRAGGGHGGVKG